MPEPLSRYKAKIKAENLDADIVNALCSLVQFYSHLLSLSITNGLKETYPNNWLTTFQRLKRREPTALHPSVTTQSENPAKHINMWISTPQHPLFEEDSRALFLSGGLDTSKGKKILTLRGDALDESPVSPVFLENITHMLKYCLEDTPFIRANET
jgi:hypothetical protein